MNCIRKVNRRVAALGLAVASMTPAQASPTAAIPVTPDNFVRAELDLYFGGAVKNGGFGKYDHTRELRLNRDTLYSSAVFDLDAGPVTITLPDPGRRFMSLQVMNQDHYTQGVHYGAGRHTLTKEGIGTRYVVTAVRTLVNPADPKDVAEVHALQDAIKVEQPAGPGKFETSQLGPGQPEEGARRPPGPRLDPARNKTHVRRQGRGRARAVPDRRRTRVWRES